ncbi:MAG: hypothetical protein K5924_12435 [Chloroflexi bacterium]|nr:hypothetical protein [Chloroflexota bacterium]
MSARLPVWVPSPAMLLAGVIVVVLAAASAAKGLVDPDYYWHVAAGRVIAESGVPSTDPFSFTWQGQPWTPHEWLSELLMDGMLAAVGPGLLLVTFGAVAGASIGIVAVGLARNSVRTVAVALPAVLAAIVFLPYVTARPQAVSWLLLAAELVLLMSLRADRPLRSLLLIPLFIAWANLHGLYVIGLGVAGVYLLFTLAGRTPMSGARGMMLAAVIGAGLSSMATPAGPAGLIYPLRYVDGSDWGLANIAEWQSPDFHDPAHVALLVMIVAVAANGGRGTPGWLAALGYLGIAMSLLALRNAPVAALLGLPTLAMGLEARLPRRTQGTVPARIALVRRIMEGSVAIAISVAAWIILVPSNLDAAAVDAAYEEFPIEAVSILASEDPDARVVAEYGWAGYVINQLYPSGGRVFVDGRNDMYPESILEDYSAIRAGDPGWERIAADAGVEWLLFPPETTITRGPAREAGWCERYRDEQQVLMGPCA